MKATIAGAMVATIAGAMVDVLATIAGAMVDLLATIAGTMVDLHQIRVGQIRIGGQMNHQIVIGHQTRIGHQINGLQAPHQMPGQHFLAMRRRRPK